MQQTPEDNGFGNAHSDSCVAEGERERGERERGHSRVVIRRAVQERTQLSRHANCDVTTCSSVWYFRVVLPVPAPSFSFEHVARHFIVYTVVHPRLNVVLYTFQGKFGLWRTIVL